MDTKTRQELIRAAVGFLQNPKLADSSLKDKLKFLKNKGLSDVEVDEALNLALISRHQSQGGRWNFLIVLGLCCAGYKLYQAYLKSKEKLASQQGDSARQYRNERSAPVSLLHAEGSHQQQGGDLVTLNDILQKMSELRKLIELQRSNFGTEIQSLKTLLLGHEKFAAPPVIPAWQLKDEDSREEPSQEKEPSPIKDNTNRAGKKNEKGKGTSTNSNNNDQPVSGNGFIEPRVIAPNLA